MTYNVGLIQEMEALVTKQWVEGQRLYISGLFKDGSVFDAYQGAMITYTGRVESIDKWLED